MRRIVYRFPAATNRVGGAASAFARAPIRAKLGPVEALERVSNQRAFSYASFLFLIAIVIFASIARAETRPHYGGTLRLMMQSAPNTFDLSANATLPAEYWDSARILSLLGDALITMDAQGRAQPALAQSWQADPSGRRWQFTLRSGVKFHDGSVVSAAAVAQILGSVHANWNVRASGDSVSIENDPALPSLLAELALPRNLILKRNANGVPIGTGPFVVAAWQPARFLKLAANDESWAGRPFVDAVEIEFGKSLREQAIALELDKVDGIETAPQANFSSQRGSMSSSSLPIELLVLVFSTNSNAQDQRVREAVALAIDRKPIQSVLLRGAGEPASSILPKWMTGYSALFSTPENPQRARTLLAGLRLPALRLSYDPRDPQAQLIAERIALNAREAGITLQVSLSGSTDLRLVRIVLPSPDSATSLSEAARQLDLALPITPRSNSLDDLYQSERGLLDGHAIIPLFHLPVSSAASARVRDWGFDQLGQWNQAGHSLADVWLSDSRFGAGTR